MRTPILAFGLAMAFLVTPVSLADFVGLVAIREFQNQMTASGVRDVYHVFAEFTNPADRVTAWYGTSASPLFIQNTAADGITPGSGFTNFGGPGGILPPEIPTTIRDWDTFATIGLRFGNEGVDGVDRTTPSVGFAPFISGNTLTSTSAQVSVETQYDLQGSAGWRVVGSDTALRVLLMQLTVLPDEHVRGSLNFNARVEVASQDLVPMTFVDQQFASIPHPSPAFVMLLWPMMGRRRRTRTQ